MNTQKENTSTMGQLKVMIVDDSRLIRSLLRVVLEQNYEVFESDNGASGLTKTLETIPDLVITDLMMPELDGYEMVQAMRRIDRVAHIPTIMLTSVDTEFNELEGYRVGVDAYLRKPFTKEQLLVRVEGLIRNRALAYKASHLYRGYNGDYAQRGLDMEASFGERLNRHVEHELNNTELKVKHLADAMAMSVSTFERRVKEHFNTSPKLFIRDYRLDNAMRLLKARKSNVSGVARECGFDNISYFSLCFREKFGFSPSEVLNVPASV
jgi:YesN/AraC family two-component response regulator